MFWVFGMARPGTEPRSPGPLANTLTFKPMSGNNLIDPLKTISEMVEGALTNMGDFLYHFDSDKK